MDVVWDRYLPSVFKILHLKRELRVSVDVSVDTRKLDSLLEGWREQTGNFSLPGEEAGFHVWSVVTPCNYNYRIDSWHTPKRCHDPQGIKSYTKRLSLESWHLTFDPNMVDERKSFCALTLLCFWYRFCMCVLDSKKWTKKWAISSSSF